MRKTFLLIILMISASLFVGQTTIRLGGGLAPLVGGIGTDTESYLNNGSWSNDQTAPYFELYLDISGFGTFTIDEIDYISYATKKGTDGTQPDFFVKIYTPANGGPSWYGYRLNAEPYFSNNLNAPANQWNEWNTSAAENELTFFDANVPGVGFGFYGQPNLADLQAGPINWNDYYAPANVTSIDYGAEEVWLMALGTGSGWNAAFLGYLDQIVISVNGTVITYDLEGCLDEVWVDDDWAGSSLGDPVGDYLFGIDAFATIQDGLAAVCSGGTVNVAAGSYTESGQFVIDKDVAIVGEGKDVTTVFTDMNTGTSGNSRAWWLVNAGQEFHLSGLTLDGTGYLIWQAIRHRGNGTIDNVCFNKIEYNQSGPNYAGTAVAIFGGPDQNVDITNSVFTEIGRVGALYFGTGITGSDFSGNTYTGKGAGDWLDYALDISAGAVVNVSGNTISNNQGVASSDGSVSAGILVTTFFGGGTTADITENDITMNSNGIIVGYDNFDASVVTANENNIYSNTNFGVYSTAPSVDATENWWGDASGPSGEGPGSGDAVGLYVDFCYWLDAAYPGGAPVLPAADAGDDQTIYIGYPPYSAQLNATGGLTYSWSPSDGLSDPNIADPIAQPAVTTTYTVTVTDAFGCVATDDVTVYVVDVRCGEYMDKIQICHIPPGNPNKSKTLCIDYEDVADHLAHGDYLGACTNGKSVLLSDEPLSVNTYPNPFDTYCNIDLSIAESSRVVITVTDLMGRVVGNIHDGELKAGDHSFTWSANTSSVGNGIYLLNISTETSTKTVKLLSK
jgi:hypothetical protein